VELDGKSCVVSIVRDITQRKRAEGDHALLAAIVESSDDAIISISPEGRVMSWNKGAERLFGFTATEALDKSTLDLFAPPQERGRVAGLIREDLAAISIDPGFVRQLEIPCLRKDRSLVDIALVVSGIHDSFRNLVGLSLIMRNITERKRVERELARYAAIVNASNDAILNVSREIKIESWNPGAERAYG
jgi:PAS domain S-box-containing protein